MIQEYYLHMFCGVNGENDFMSSAGRIAIGTLMAGYGLPASTKKDLQNRVQWETTPGCFLGQKEIREDYNTRNNLELRFMTQLVDYKKVNRTINYCLDWSKLAGDWDYSCTSEVWIAIAKMYWLGYFLFGRNVIPDAQMALLRERFSVHYHDQLVRRKNLQSPFIMQFFQTCGFLTTPISAPEDHLFKGVSFGEPLSREKIFGSLAMAMNPQANAPGFFVAGSLLSRLAQPGQHYGNCAEIFSEWSSYRTGVALRHTLPLIQPYYYAYGIGTPRIPSGNGNISCRDTMALLFCQLDRSPSEEAATRYFQVHAGPVNWEIVGHNEASYITCCILYEYNLLLTGQEMFPLDRLHAIRVERDWSEESLRQFSFSMPPLETKNCTVREILRFHLLRQNQV